MTTTRTTKPCPTCGENLNDHTHTMHMGRAKWSKCPACGYDTRKTADELPPYRPSK